VEVELEVESAKAEVEQSIPPPPTEAPPRQPVAVQSDIVSMDIRHVEVIEDPVLKNVDTKLYKSGLAVAMDSMARFAEEPKKMNRFHSVRAPAITAQQYLERIAKFFQCSDECFVMAMVYIDRLIKLQAEIQVSSLTCHRLLITSVTLAAKFNDDQYYSNAYYAKVGGLHLAELNVLEKTFLQMLDWKVQVTPEEFAQYQKIMLQAAASAQK